MPSCTSLTFEEAVRLFKQWGFQVEPGPRPEEVTLISQAPGYRTYSVHPASELTRMAAAASQVRWRNGAACNATPPARKINLPCPLRAPAYIH